MDNLELAQNKHIKLHKNISVILIILFLIIHPSVNLDIICPKEKPILKNNQCQAIFCTDEEFKNEICTKNDEIIEVQWMNNFQIFDNSVTTNSNALQCPNGYLLLFSQKIVDGNIKNLIYGFKKNGDGSFYDENSDNFYNFKSINSDNIKENKIKFEYIEIKNKGYLLSTPTENKNMYLLDYEEETFSKIATTTYSPKYSDSIIKLKNFENDVYLMDYIYCENENIYDCYIYMSIFSINENGISELIKIPQKYKANYKTKLNCFQNVNNYIVCTYTNIENTDNELVSKHLISVFNPNTLNQEFFSILEEIFDEDAIFDSTIELNNSTLVIAYSTPKNKDNIKVLFKNLKFNSSYTSPETKFEFKDHINSVSYVIVKPKSENYLKYGNSKSNNLMKININKFALFLGVSQASENLDDIMIVIFNIFNGVSNLNVRYYNINLKLYGMNIVNNIKGYLFNDFIGVLLEVKSSNENNKYFENLSTFLTFGYVNKTEFSELTKIKLLKNKSKIKINDYIKNIENNLFGYQFLGVKILSLPDDEECGYFVDFYLNKLLEENVIIDLYEVLQFFISENYTSGNYSISFAAVVKEPNYETLNEFSDKIENYPYNDINLEKNYYEPKELLGKKIEYIFELKFPDSGISENEEEEEEEEKEYPIDISWLKKFYIFNEGNISGASSDVDSKGNLYFFAQKYEEGNSYEKYIKGFDKTGNGIFFNGNQKSSFYNFNLAFDSFVEKIKYIENENKTFLLSTQSKKNMYAFNLEKGTSVFFNFDDESYLSDTIFEYAKYPDIFFTDFIHCKQLNDCYIYLKNFNLSKNLDFKEIKTNKDNIKVHYQSNLKCIDNEYFNVILCTYSPLKSFTEDIYSHVLGVFDPETLNSLQNFILEEDIETKIAFDDMIQLNINCFVIAYSESPDVIRVLLKELTIDFDLQNYVREVPIIYINDDHYYSIHNGNCVENSLFKINDDKFAILINDYDFDFDDDDGYNPMNNPFMGIIIFTIYNNVKNVNVRHYLMDLEKHNRKITGNILGYNLQNFFGVLMELSNPNNESMNSAAYVTFGYINGTDYIEYDLINENEESKIIKLKNYLNEIENNLFKYKIEGIKIISLPNETDCGYFTDEKNNIINESNIIDYETEIKLILNNNHKKGYYTVIFAGAVKEPDYEIMNNISFKTENYPINKNISEEQFYIPKILLGRYINYTFYIKTDNIEKKCFENCDGCLAESEDINNQYCDECKENYYFVVSTLNCLPKDTPHYYFDENDEELAPCYEDCNTCDNSGIFDEMNCLSCYDGFIYNQTSKNCIKCPKYINYEHTNCINEIPNGFYLKNETLGTIEKCYKLCETCENGPYFEGGILKMNCLLCKYNSKNNENITGNCPEKNDDIFENQCPREKPILINNNCVLEYCDKESYENKICEIKNEIVKKQWLNNFHIFDDEFSSNIACDVNEKGEVFLMGQLDNDFDEKGSVIKYLYGFSSDGNGLFYDENKKNYYSYKIINTEYGNVFKSVKYIDESKKGYLLTTQNDDSMFLIDYKQNNISIIKTNVSTNYDGNVFQMHDSEIYFSSFITCNENKKCFLNFRKYNMKRYNEFILTQEVIKNINIKPETKLTCYQNEQNYIQCTFTKDEKNAIHCLTLFNPKTLETEKTFDLDNFFLPEYPFDSMIKLLEDVSVIAYSINNNVIKILIKKINYIYNESVSDVQYVLEDYLPGVKEIKINQDNLYKFEGGNSYKNILYKMSENKFMMVVNDYNGKIYNEMNSKLVIFTFHIYNSHENINIRHYPINFELYNLYIDEFVKGYNINNYFGILIELKFPETSSTSLATFFTFGYINATQDISVSEGTKILSKNKNKINVENYINNIENNLFGYEFLGVIILALPPENVGHFYKKNNESNFIKIGDIIDINTELIFVENDNIPLNNYFISFAGIVKEPDYEILNNFSTKLENYYSNKIVNEKDFYEPKQMIGKKFTFNFEIGNPNICYKNCLNCKKFSNNENNQQCTECKSGYYFIENTNNCFNEAPKKYFFNKQKNVFSACYSNCLTCNGVSSGNQMNCITCIEGFKYYKSTNCLNCEKYVDYSQIKCIENIPDGYFLENKQLGTIGKCHDLCKTCKNYPYLENNIIHMNCESCLYKNEKFKSNIEGNCPDSENKNVDEKNKNYFNLNKYLLWSIIGVFFVIIAIILIIACVKYDCKCKICKKKVNIHAATSDYYGFHKNDIPMEEDAQLGI